MSKAIFLTAVLPIVVGKNNQTFFVPAATLLSQKDFELSNNFRKLMTGKTGQSLLGNAEPATMPEGPLLQELMNFSHQVVAKAIESGFEPNLDGIPAEEQWNFQLELAAEWLKDQAPSQDAASAAAEEIEPAEQLTTDLPTAEDVVEAANESPEGSEALEEVQEILSDMGIEPPSQEVALIIAQGLTAQRNVSQATVALSSAALKEIDSLEASLSKVKKAVTANLLINEKAVSEVDQILSQYNLSLPPTVEQSEVPTSAE